MVALFEWLKENKLFGAILGLFVLTQLVVIASIWNKPLLWDSSVFVATGKYVFSLGEYGFWSSWGAPGVPVVIGFFWSLGVSMLGYPRVLWLGVSALGALVFYLITDRLFGRTEALATSGIILSSGTYYFFTNEVLTGIPSSIMVFVSLYFLNEERYVSSGVFAGLAFLLRYPAAIVGPAAVFFILMIGLRDKKVLETVLSFFKYSVAVAVTVAPYLIFLQIYEGSMFGPLFDSAGSTAGVGSSVFDPSFYAVEAVFSNPLMIFMPIGVYAVLKYREWDYGAFLSGLVFFYLFFSMFPLRIERYMLPFIPLMALFSARGLIEVKYVYERRSPSPEVFSSKLFSPKLPERMNRKSFDLILGSFIVLLMVSSFLTTYGMHAWEEPERYSFLEETGSLEGHVVTNDPSTNLYGDFRYYPIPPTEPSGRYDELSGEVDYWAINSCNWDCRGNPECENAAEQLENNLDQDKAKVFETRDNRCIYTIFED